MSHKPLPPSQRFEFDSLFVNPDSKTPLFRQLESQLRESIWRGLLKPGERLPSTRALAKQLQVARNTVISAYEQLAAEGFLITQKGDGTRVTSSVEQLETAPKAKKPRLISQPTHHALAARYTRYADTHKNIINNPNARPFRAHRPDVSAFPSNVWAQLTSRRTRGDAASWLASPSSQGYQPLREAIADYLGAARGITTTHQHIIMTAGAQQGVELLAKMLINPGDVIVFEDPGYTPAMAVFEMMGATIVSIAVDECGIDTEQLARLKQPIKMIYTTPASHFPLSINLSQARRKLLIEWAQANNCLILEDDYNGEYRYCGRPAATLYEQCESTHVIYMSTFSKLLFPSLRLGFLVVPEQFIQPLNTLRWLLDRHSPTLEQAVLTDFINEGYFSSHLRKMRTLYLQRQQALLNAANEHLCDILWVPPLEGGLHLVGWLQHSVTETKLLSAADAAGVELAPTSQYYRLPIERASVLMGYAAYSEQQLLESVLALKHAYDNPQ